MTIEEFKQRYPILSAGMSDDQIRELVDRPEPDPSVYYFDWLIQNHAHFSWTFTPSRILQCSVLMMHN